MSPLFCSILFPWAHQVLFIVYYILGFIFIYISYSCAPAIFVFLSFSVLFSHAIFTLYSAEFASNTQNISFFDIFVVVNSKFQFIAIKSHKLWYLLDSKYNHTQNWHLAVSFVPFFIFPKSENCTDGKTSRT